MLVRRKASMDWASIEQQPAAKGRLCKGPVVARSSVSTPSSAPLARRGSQNSRSIAPAIRGQKASELDYGRLFNEMFAIGRRYHVRPVTDMTLVLVALVTAQGIGKMLDPTVDVFAHVAQHLVPVLQKRNERVPDTDVARAAAAR